MPVEQMAGERMSSLRVGYSCVGSARPALRQYVTDCMQIT